MGGDEVGPETAIRTAGVHTLDNVLDSLPKSAQPGAGKAPQKAMPLTPHGTSHRRPRAPSRVFYLAIQEPRIIRAGQDRAFATGFTGVSRRRKSRATPSGPGVVTSAGDRGLSAGIIGQRHRGRDALTHRLPANGKALADRPHDLESVLPDAARVRRQDGRHCRTAVPVAHLSGPVFDLQRQQARARRVLSGIGHQLAHHQLNHAHRAAGHRQTAHRLHIRQEATGQLTSLGDLLAALEGCGHR
jgi:hypothetical protein